MKVKPWVRIVLNKTLEPVGFQVSRFRPEATSRRMLTPRLRACQYRAFRQQFVEALEGFPDLRCDRIQDPEIDGFLDALFKCPVRQQTGGSGVNAALLLWALARTIRPNFIVESGVLRGFTSWVLERAVPEAEIHSFDLSFADLRFRSPKIHYYQHDWMEADVAPPDRDLSLGFFDDHVDQWRRVREAAERGFRYLVFDDSLPASALHGDGNAAYPTLDMLFEDGLPDGELIEWQTECGRFSVRYDRPVSLETRCWIRHHARLPSLHFATGYAPANLTLVETVPKVKPGSVIPK